MTNETWRYSVDILISRVAVKQYRTD